MVTIIQFPEKDFENSIIKDVMEPLYQKLDTYKNELIYVSLGGKVNERILTYNDGRSGGGSKLNTNSLYQMCPSFLQNQSMQREIIVKPDNTPYKCLCIIVDSFLHHELERNIEIVNYFSEINDMSNIEVCIINNTMHTCIEETSKSKVDFLRFWLADLCNELKNREISSEHFMLCNFIKFKNLVQREGEETYETYVKNAISAVMHENEYENSHYEWFGYSNSLNYLLYDFIYKNVEITENELLNIIINISRFYQSSLREIDMSIPKNAQIYEMDWKRLFLNKFIKEKTKNIMSITPAVYDGKSIDDLFSCSLYDIIVNYKQM